MSAAKKMTKVEVLRRLKGLDENTQKAMACALIGHSDIVTSCFGYVSCSRCGAHLGDTLAGAYSNDNAVVVGHNCPTCRKNYERLTWRDTFMAPDPFAKETA